MPDLFDYDKMEWSSKFLKFMLTIRDGAGNPVDETMAEFAGSWDGSPDLGLYYPMQVRYTAIIVPPGGGEPVWP